MASIRTAQSLSVIPRVEAKPEGRFEVHLGPYVVHLGALEAAKLSAELAPKKVTMSVVVGT